MATKKHKSKVTLELTYNQALGLMKATEYLARAPKEERWEIIGDKRLVGPALIALDTLREKVAEADGKRVVTINSPL